MAHGGQATFVTACESPALRDRIRDASATLLEITSGQALDTEYTKDVVLEQHGAALVVDGYTFDSAYQQGVRTPAIPLVAFDDYAHAGHYYADLVINQNLDADKLAYPRAPHTQLLLGAEYVILRPEFLAWKGRTRTFPKRAARVLVTLGGSDPDNVTMRVVRALEALGRPDLEAQIVVGAGSPHRAGLEAAAAQSSAKLRLEFNVRDMAARMAWADLVVAAGGTTCWELAYMGAPSAIIMLADNQQRGVDALVRRDCVDYLGRSETASVDSISQALDGLLNDRDRRQALSHASMQLVDGLGAERVVKAISELIDRNRTCLP